MKQFLPILTVVTMIAASCHTSPEVKPQPDALQAYKDSVRLAADTAGLSQFQAWKAQHELSDVNQYNANTETAAAAPVKKTVVYTPVHKTTRSSTASSRSTDYSSGTMTSESGNTAKASVKKGWSKAAKGAAIGGGVGAVTGAVINKKNRAVGAVIGGVLGGGVGYGIGRHMDKKDGRY